MKSFIEKFIVASGYDSTQHFLDSAFHPKLTVVTATFSAISGTLGYVFDHVFGIHWLVALILVVLFTVELYTGIKASKKDGYQFDSEKFGKGWLKLFIYMIMIGASNILAIYVPVKPILGFTFNIYEWLHYAFYNYVLLNLFWSNIENFVRLGWDDYLPILKKLKKYVKDETPVEKAD